MTKDLIIICGPSASGKDTIFKGILSTNTQLFNPVILSTTRPRRENEIEDVDYHYITTEEAIRMVISGEAISAQEYNNWHYLIDEKSLVKDKINIGVFSPATISQMADNNFEGLKIVIFYIMSSDKTRLLRSLLREKNPDISEIIRRYGTDKKDFNNFEKEFLQYPLLITIDNDKTPLDVNLNHINFIIKDLFH